MVRHLLKYLIFNFLVFLSLVFIIELIFGDWLKSNNFGSSIRELRNINIPMSVKYEEKKYNYIFKRNNNGFIGEEIDPDEIKIIFLGGSTGEEMFKPYKNSIVGILNKKFKKDKFEYNIVNASKGGKSTRGYVNDFNYWFSKIENFNPRIFIFYIGINDSSLDIPEYFDEPIKNNINEKIEDYFKNNSIFYKLKKKFQNKYFSNLRKYYGLQKENLYQNFNFTNYNVAKKRFSNVKPNVNELIILENLSKNLDNLKDIIENKKIFPIFITQINYEGLNNHSLFLVNEYLKEFCKINNYDIIKLDEKNYILDNKDFYDEVHTTIKGSQKISNLIYPDLKIYLNNNSNLIN